MSLDRSDQYDPYIPGSNPNQPGGGPGPAASTGGASGSKTQDIQREIDATVGIMRDNITKVAERGERLDALQDKTGAFQLRAPLRGSVSGTRELTSTSAGRQPRAKCARVPEGREPRSQEDGASASYRLRGPGTNASLASQWW